jgi:hypothetical protein
MVTALPTAEATERRALSGSAFAVWKCKPHSSTFLSVFQLELAGRDDFDLRATVVVDPASDEHIAAYKFLRLAEWRTCHHALAPNDVERIPLRFPLCRRGTLSVGKLDNFETTRLSNSLDAAADELERMPIQDELAGAVRRPDLIGGVGPQAEARIPCPAFEGHEGCQTRFTSRRRMGTGAPHFDKAPLNPDLIGVRLDDQVCEHSAISIRAVLWNKSQRHATTADKSFERIVRSGGGRPSCGRSPGSDISGPRRQNTDQAHLHPVIEQNGLTVYRANYSSGWASLEGTRERCRRSLKRDAGR